MEKPAFFTTEDGSPTLVTTYESGVTEKMHHFRGAFSESVYIYEPAISLALGALPSATVQICSLGLGLGYNEILAACVSLSLKKVPLRLVTFEIDPLLVNELNSYLEGRSQGEWAEAYDDIVRRSVTHFGLEAGELKSTLLNWVKMGIWQIRGPFPESLNNEDQFNSILYDAFSRKMDGPLWSEEFLKKFLDKHSAKSCAFATYAATGALKRSLKQAGYSLTKKSGFGGKKESTFAVRRFELDKT